MIMPAKHELSVVECIAVFKAGDVSRAVRVNVREDERRKWKAYYLSIRKDHSRMSRGKKIRKNIHSRSSFSKLSYAFALEYSALT